MRIAAPLVFVFACGTSGPAPEPATSPASPASPQTFAQGIQLLCDLPDHVPDNGEPYDRRLVAVADWAEHHVVNAEAKRVGSVTSLAANRDAFAAAVTKAGITHCKLLDNGMELQSYADAMTILCDGAGKSPAYFKSHMLNTEVVRMMGQLGEAAPADRARRMREAVARAGLSTCHLTDAASSPMPAPAVADRGLDALDPQRPTLVITPTAIVIEGKAIVSVTGGDVDPAEKEGGALGVAIERVQKFVTALEQELAAHTPAEVGALTLVVDPATPYRLLVEVMFSCKRAGVTSFALAVNTGATTKAMPITLLPHPGPKVGVGLTVTRTRTQLLLWSTSGSEGSLKAPKLAVASDRVAELGKALAAIVARRWPSGTRGADDLRLVIQADDAVPMQAMAELLVAVRTTDDGTELFHDLTMSGLD